MTRERFEEIFDDENIISAWEGDNAFQGLLIINKYIGYMQNALIAGASHDEIQSVDVEDLINAGITEEDVISLRKLNWMINDDYLACFV